MQQPKVSDTKRVVESNICIVAQCTLDRRVNYDLRNPHVRSRCIARLKFGAGIYAEGDYESRMAEGSRI
jgi:hypothetical protein